MSLIVIPARLASKRLHGKALIKICGRELILRVIDRCVKSVADRVVVITDSKEIYNVCKKSVVSDVIIDKTQASCGTDRAAYVLNRYGDSIILNVQCDEPFIPPELLNLLIEDLKNNVDYINTPYVEIDEWEAKDQNTVKVVINKNNFALYFSRTLIPYQMDSDKRIYNKHIGVYGFHRETLIAFASLKTGNLERKEHLEQLRALENNIPIKMLKWPYNIIAINVLADIKKAEKYLEGVNIHG